MPVIPAGLIELMITFCTKRATGQILFHVHEGRITSYSVTEIGKVDTLITGEKNLASSLESTLSQSDIDK